MFSHIVIFWTDPAKPDAADEVIAGAKNFFKDIPACWHFTRARWSPSHRPVVDQTYQVALNISFSDKHAEHRISRASAASANLWKHVKPFVKKVVVYDFE